MEFKKIMNRFILKARKSKNLTLEVSICVLGIVGSLVGAGVLILGTPSSCTKRLAWNIFQAGVLILLLGTPS